MGQYTSRRFKLTQNTRLKANIRYLTHISPPDNAAMAAPGAQNHTLRLLSPSRRLTTAQHTVCKKRLHNSLCRMRLFPDAQPATDSCVVLCASVLFRPPRTTGLRKRNPADCCHADCGCSPHPTPVYLFIVFVSLFCFVFVFSGGVFAGRKILSGWNCVSPF